MEQETDHDNLITLIADVKNLKLSQDEFHKEMRGAIKELQNNYSSRIDAHETRLNSLETSKTKQNTTMSIAIGILSVLVSLLVWHLFQS